MAQFVAVASFCRYDTYSKKLWEQPAVQFYLLTWSMLNMWGMGRFVYWNVKYYLFCRKLCRSQRETCLPVDFSFLFYNL